MIEELARAKHMCPQKQDLYERTRDLITMNMIHAIVANPVFSGPHNDPVRALHLVYHRYYSDDRFREVLNRFSDVLLNMFPNPEPSEEEPDASA